jgi:hypothetical protein|tara:strand:- start:98 stop:280 length:183 start_codon:yes stop_codon:yes gene_type:complete
MKTLQDLKDLIEGLENKYQKKAEDIILTQTLMFPVTDITCLAVVKGDYVKAEINFIFSDD